MSVQDLARTLAAAGSLRLPDSEEEGIYLIHVSDGNLVESFWVGEESKNETVIASDAKTDTSASYLLAVSPDDVKRRVLFIDQSNAIQCYVCDNETEEWEDTGLGEKWSITTSPKSKLSSTIGPDGQAVISYQDTAGRLTGITSAGGGEWKALSPLEADPVVGTPQLLDVIDDKLHLFYVGKDGSIRYQVLDPMTSSWQDNALRNAKFDTLINNFSVAKTSTDSFQSYYLTAGSLWNIDGDKEKTHLGKVEGDGKLIPSDKAQAGWRVWWRGARRVRISRNTINIWY